MTTGGSGVGGQVGHGEDEEANQWNHNQTTISLIRIYYTCVLRREIYKLWKVREFTVR